jgi:ribA/ribD-fused uncharacterized protein
MPLFPTYDQNAIFFSMDDESSKWCRASVKPFELEDHEWQTVEHYFQAMRFVDKADQALVRESENPASFAKLNKSWFRKKRKDWNEVKKTIMTRALFMQCQVYPEMAEALLETGDNDLVENSQYDYFWGCGRDRRGDNHYGKVLMAIRAKLKETKTS